MSKYLSYKRNYRDKEKEEEKEKETSPKEDDDDNNKSTGFRRRQERERYHTTSIDYNTLNNMTQPSSGTGTGSNKLAQEINDEFLTCKICLEGYKSPKCLDCLHTFCEQCIDNHVMSECTYKKYSDYREFTCPLCRKRTTLPIGGVKKLPDNFIVSNLSEIIDRTRPSKFPFCDICKLINRKHREASTKCLDCNKLLCKQCVELHKDTKVTKNHSLFDVEIEKDIECKEHPEEVVRFYCEPCDACICVLCTFNEHKDHEITSFSDAVYKYKEMIQTLLDGCKGKLDSYDNQLTILSKCDDAIKAAEQKIRDSAIQSIAEIRSKEKGLIDDLHVFYGTEIMEYISRRTEMQSNLDSLKSTCNLTEIVLRGKDMELLLLKKQVQEKLSCLSDVEIKELPCEVQKSMTFVPGHLDFGTLQDADKPISKFKSQRSSSSSNLPEPRFVKTSWTQTDEVAQTDADIQTNCPDGIHCASDKCTATEAVETMEKAVNTRSRSLTSGTHQLSRVQATEDTASDNTGPEPSSSPTTRRHRRRRERPKPVEVTVRPTTNTPQARSVHVLNSPTEAGSVYSFSSSVDEYYSPDGESINGVHNPVSPT
ncbi:hypothetical protein ScPMuIL_005340 [Solemya velum]